MTERFIHPKREDIPRLKEIWLECFPEDTDGYCDFFFENHFIPERTTAVECDGVIHGAIYFFDAFFMGKDGKKYPFLMSYGAGVEKSFRGRNSMFRMYEEACAEAFRNGIYGLVAFSSDELVDVYDKHGFKRLFGIYRIVGNTDERMSVPEWRECSYEEFKKLREALLEKKKSYFGWTENSLFYMYSDVFTSGEVVCCQYKDERRYAVCSYSGEELVIRETDFPSDETDALLTGIAKHFGTNSVSLYSDIPIHSASCERIYYGHYILSDDFPFPEDVPNAYINIIAD